jgi:hypothetical protein
MRCHFIDTGLSNKSAQYLRTRDVYGVGVDTPSIDPGKNVIFEAHHTLLGAQIFGIENLKLEKDVLPGKWQTAALKDQMPPFVTLRVASYHPPSSLRSYAVVNLILSWW